jgi:hypothetical protein
MCRKSNPTIKIMPATLVASKTRDQASNALKELTKAALPNAMIEHSPRGPEQCREHAKFLPLFTVN